MAGIALVVAGAIAGVAWLWTAYRVQERADHLADVEPITFDDSPAESLEVTGWMADAFGDTLDLTLADRLDLLAQDVELALTGVLAVAVGLGARLAADYAVARTGGSLTGYQVGDRV